MSDTIKEEHAPMEENYVSIEGRALAKAIAPVLAALDRSPILPILECVLLRSDGEALHVEGTNLDTHMMATVAVDSGSGQWQRCIPARLLHKIAKEAGRDVITITGDKKITAGVAEYYIEDHDPDEFARADRCARGNLIESFGNGSLSEFLSRVSPQVSREETRYYLNGVHWVRDANGARFEATNGHALSVLSIGAKPGADAERRIIPSKAVTLIERYFRGMDIAVYQSGVNTIDIVSDGLSMRTKLIDGTFPDVDRVIPKQEAVTAVVKISKDELISAVKKAALLVGRGTTPSLRMHGVKGCMHISRVSADGVGTASVKTSAAWPDTMQDFGFSAKILQLILSSCAGEVTLKFCGLNAPVIVEDSDESMTRVFMGMRL